MPRKLLIAGGAAVALAAGGIGATTALGTEQEDATVSGASADQARNAAVKYTGGGRAGSVERDNEHGATWGVEVTKPDGAPVDVRLDASYKLVQITSNADG